MYLKQSCRKFETKKNMAKFFMQFALKFSVFGILSQCKKCITLLIDIRYNQPSYFKIFNISPVMYKKIFLCIMSFSFCLPIYPFFVCFIAVLLTICPCFPILYYVNKTITNLRISTSLAIYSL